MATREPSRRGKSYNDIAAQFTRLANAMYERGQAATTQEERERWNNRMLRTAEISGRYLSNITASPAVGRALNANGGSSITREDIERARRVRVARRTYMGR